LPSALWEQYVRPFRIQINNSPNQIFSSTLLYLPQRPAPSDQRPHPPSTSLTDAFTLRFTVLPSTWDVIVSCANNDYCCTSDNDGDQGCCAANTAAPVATVSASLTIFALDVATTVTVIGSAGYTAVGSALIIPGASTTTKPSPQATTAATKADGSSSRTIIGIGVGAGVGGFVLALILALCGWTSWKRQCNLRVSRRQQSNSQWQDDEGNALARPMEVRQEFGAEMLGSSVCIQDGSVCKGAHVGVVERTELDGRARGVELPG
jgi:hypothetical protein